MRTISRGKVDFRDLITHRFPLTKTDEAFEVFEKKTGDPMAIAVLTREA